MTTTTQPLHWVELEYDTDDILATLVWGETLVADIGHDDALWISPVNDPVELKRMFKVDHNAVEVTARKDTVEEAKAAAAEYFSTL